MGGGYRGQQNNGGYRGQNNGVFRGGRNYNNRSWHSSATGIPTQPTNNKQDQPQTGTIGGSTSSGVDAVSLPAPVAGKICLELHLFSSHNEINVTFVLQQTNAFKGHFRALTHIINNRLHVPTLTNQPPNNRLKFQPPLNAKEVHHTATTTSDYVLVKFLPEDGEYIIPELLPKRTNHNYSHNI